MAKNNVTNIKTDGGPAFMGKVDNRGGQIYGRNNKNIPKKVSRIEKSKIEEFRIQIIVAIIGAIAVIVAAIIRAILSQI